MYVWSRNCWHIRAYTAQTARQPVYSLQHCAFTDSLYVSLVSNTAASCMVILRVRVTATTFWNVGWVPHSSFLSPFITISQKNCPHEMTRFYGHDALDVILAGMQHQIPPGELTALPQTPKLAEARKQKQKQCSTLHCLSQSDTNAMQLYTQLSELGAINKC